MKNVASPHKILIIEDEATLRRALTDKFTREGFVVCEAREGEAGLEVALREQPEIILLDMMMPKTDGIVMLHQLRGASAWGKKVPVILLTNISSDDKRMLREVFDDISAKCLVKSDWPIARLVEYVKKVLVDGFEQR